MGLSLSFGIYFKFAHFWGLVVEFIRGMALTKRSVQGTYPVASWMFFFREVSVVIVSRDQEEVLGACLETLFKTSAPWKEVIVVDNASTDGTTAMLEERFPKVKHVVLDKPQGMGAFNFGYAAAEGEWVLSLDYNCAPDVDSWQGLCRILACDPDSDVISFSVVRQLRENLRQMNRASLVEAGNFVHGGFLFKRSCFQQMGGFDETIPEQGSELHWAARTFVKGHDILHCAEACIVRSGDLPKEDLSLKAEQITASYLLLALRFAPESVWRDLVRLRIRDILVYSILHQSLAYVRALRNALREWVDAPEKIQRLEEADFKRLGVDWRMPFGFLD